MSTIPALLGRNFGKLHTSGGLQTPTPGNTPFQPHQPSPVFNRPGVNHRTWHMAKYTHYFLQFALTDPHLMNKYESMEPLRRQRVNPDLSKRRSGRYEQWVRNNRAAVKGAGHE